MFTEIEQVVSSLNFNFNNINLIYIDDKMDMKYIDSTLKSNKDGLNTFLVIYNSCNSDNSKFNKLLNEFNIINIIYLNNELILGSNIDSSFNLLDVNKLKVEDFSSDEYGDIIKNIILLLSQTILDNNKLYSINQNKNNITLWKLIPKQKSSHV